jgi:hypothetical protein
MKLLGTVFLLTVLGASAARAQPSDAPCVNGAVPTERDLGLAKVVGAGRLNFLNEGPGCPSEAATCRQRAYVVSGDLLLTGRSAGAYVCVFYPNTGGGSAGWVQSARLARLPVDVAPPPSAWAGRWANEDDSIVLKVKGAALVADGHAYYPSAHPPASQFPGGPNLGDLSGTATPNGKTVVFTDKDPNGCTAALTLVGGLLVVADDGHCGGMNVSFSGVYKRK